MPAAISSARCGGVSSSSGRPAPASGSRSRQAMDAESGARHDRLLLAHERLRPDVGGTSPGRPGFSAASACRPGCTSTGHMGLVRCGRSGRFRRAQCGCGAFPARRADRRAHRCRAARAWRRDPAPDGRSRAPLTPTIDRPASAKRGGAVSRMRPRNPRHAVIPGVVRDGDRAEAP